MKLTDEETPLNKLTNCQKLITVVAKMSQETNPEVGRRSKNSEKWSQNIGKKARNKVQLVQITIELAKNVLIFE